MKAVTLSYDMGGLDTADPTSEASVLEEDTGDVIDSLLGNQIAEPNADAAGLGESLGMLAGAGLGSLVGPAGTALGSGPGKNAGGWVERRGHAGDAVTGPADAADLLAGGPGGVRLDVPRDRVADVLRPDRELRHGVLLSRSTRRARRLRCRPGLGRAGRAVSRSCSGGDGASCLLEAAGDAAVDDVLAHPDHDTPAAGHG